MSYQLLKEDVLFYQRLLKSCGFYTDRLDGRWGQNTDAADKAFLQKSTEIADLNGRFDVRSEENIITLIPKAQVLARKFLKILINAGFDVRIISGTRTYAEQDVLYRQGRSGNPGNVITNAKGGQSNHNFGLAWDIGLFENGKYITTDSKYKQLSAPVLAVLPDLEWGGNWNKFPDFPHYQQKALVDGTTAVRNLFETGSQYA